MQPIEDAAAADPVPAAEPNEQMASAPPPPTSCSRLPDAFDEHAISLTDAIEFALQNNPRLRVAQEAIEQARGGKLVEFSPFLPYVRASYRDVVSASPLQGFTGTELPFVVGFGAGTQEFQLSEIHMHWTLWDFGRTLGRYEQAVNRTEIAELQFMRAKQTIAYDVAAAYFRVLLAQATRLIQAQAVRRAESFLNDSRNLLKGGAVTRDSVLRAEVELATVRQGLVAAQSAELVASAALNLAMGRNVSAPIHLVEIADEPVFRLSLAESLQLAVENRREFAVVLKQIEVARQGLRVTRADFLPQIYIRGTVAHVAGEGVQTGDVKVGGFHIDQNLFEGGRRVGEMRTASAALRGAGAQAQVVCDNIAFEVNQAYWSIDDARQRIDLSRTAVTQAQENLRLVVNKFQHGDATPTDVVDAETAMTRAQQQYSSALYDYLTALARLEYAMGTTTDGSFMFLSSPAHLEEGANACTQERGPEE